MRHNNCACLCCSSNDNLNLLLSFAVALAFLQHLQCRFVFLAVPIWLQVLGSIVCVRNERWHHGKPSFKKAMIGSGSAAHVYFWDGRDGFSNWGWLVGPKIGGDDVWAYNPICNGSGKNKNPPCTGWQVLPGFPDEELFVEELPAPPPSAVLVWERKSTVRKDGRTCVSWKPILEEPHPLLKKRRIDAERKQ